MSDQPDWLLRWQETELRTLPVAFRNDGFSTYFREPPMTRETLETEYIDPLVGTNLRYLGWGVGPSSVLCYDSEVGTVFGRPITEQQWDLFRTGDRWVHENLENIIAEGADPLDIAVEYGHANGLKVYARNQMNHEYGPPKDDNFLWVGLVGEFNKQHPEFRIPGSTHLDFKHQEVRDFRLAVLREVAEKGVDAVMADFTVYPPHFEEPDPAIGTQFIRDVRAMLDEVGEAQDREIELIVELPCRNTLEMGLDWRTWMREGLVDVIVPTRFRSGRKFDLRIDEFVELGRETGTRVWGFILHFLGYVTTDLTPADERKGLKRYSKPKTQGMFFAQALMYHRAGVDGLEIAGSMGTEWAKRPWYSDLADPEKVLYADKHYTVDVDPYIPVEFDLPEEPPYVAESTVELRIADDVGAAREAGHEVEAELVFYSRGLEQVESLSIRINEHEPLIIEGGTPEEEAIQPPIYWLENRAAYLEGAEGRYVSEADWWRRGEHRVEFDVEYLRLGTNTIRFEYSTTTPAPEHEFRTSWIDVLIRYREA